MKHLLKITFISLVCMSYRPAGGEKVYICDSKSSVAYHDSKSCRGIRRCTHEIIEVTKKDAVDKYAKRACKICY